MPEVWFCIPSMRDEDSTVPVWKAAGYGIALWRNPGAVSVRSDLLIEAPYPGYAQAVNSLVAKVLALDAECQWVVCGGDDILPEPTFGPAELARQLTEHFAGTFGCCQFTADPWGDKDGPYIQRVAGSPWLGREFCRRVNQGNGPLWSAYTHQFVDAELQEVATRLGIFWQRPDLSHHHQHWGRPKPGERYGNADRMPSFLTEANSPRHWNKFKALFEERKAAGFPGSDPL